MKTNINFSTLTKSQLVSKVVTANKSVNEGMYIIGKCAIEATSRLKIKRKDFANDCGITESMMSKAISAVKYFDEVGGTDFADFSYTKLALVSRKPELFKDIVDAKGLSGLNEMSKANVEAIANGSATFKGYDKKTGLAILNTTKSDTKGKGKSEDKSKDLITVTDANGIKYNVPADILAKYKVEE